MRAVVADTGVIVAAADLDDRNHTLCIETISDLRSDGVIVPSTVAVEVDYLLRTRLGPKTARSFLEDLEQGRYIWEPVDERALIRSVEVDRIYHDLGIGLVDASVVAVAEQVDAWAILTLDVSHFSVSAPGFRLEPAA